MNLNIIVIKKLFKNKSSKTFNSAETNNVVHWPYNYKINDSYAHIAMCEVMNLYRITLDKEY